MSTLGDRYLAALEADGRYVDPVAEKQDLEHRLSMVKDHLKNRLFQLGDEASMERLNAVIGEDIL